MMTKKICEIMPWAQSDSMTEIWPPTVTMTVQSVRKMAMSTRCVGTAKESSGRLWGRPRKKTMKRAPMTGMMPKLTRPAKKASPPQNRRKWRL